MLPFLSRQHGAVIKINYHQMSALRVRLLSVDAHENYHQRNLLISMIELIWCSAAAAQIVVLFGAACGAQLPR